MVQASIPTPVSQRLLSDPHNFHMECIMGKTVNGYEYELSTAKGKKLMTVVKGKKVHFGNIDYEHFHDKTGLLPKRLNHDDKVRRPSYLARTAKIKRKDGSMTANDPSSPNFHARNVLW